MSKQPSDQEKRHRTKLLNMARHRVRQYLNKGNPEGLAHMGDMPANMPEAKRILIALQDEYEKLVHGMDRKQAFIDRMRKTVDALASRCDHLTTEFFALSTKYHKLNSENRKIKEMLDEQTKKRIEAEQTSADLANRLMKTQNALDCAMATLKLAQNDGNV